MDPRKLVAAALLLATLATSCAATLHLSWTNPTQDNNAACGLTPNLTQSPPNAYCVTRFTFSQGSTVLRDSVVGRAGQAFFQRPFVVPSGGVWHVDAVLADSVGNVSCPASLDVTIKGPFHALTDLR